MQGDFGGKAASQPKRVDIWEGGMKTLHMTELCERWAQELGRLPLDCARILAAHILRPPDDPQRLSVEFLLPPSQRSYNIDDPQPDAEDEQAWREFLQVALHRTADEGEGADWENFACILVERAELERWLAVTNALPSPAFWIGPTADGATSAVNALSPTSPAPVACPLPASTPSQAALLKIIAALAIVLTRT